MIPDSRFLTLEKGQIMTIAFVYIQKRAQVMARGFVSIEYQMMQTLTININISSSSPERLMHIANFIAMFLPREGRFA